MENMEKVKKLEVAFSKTFPQERLLVFKDRQVGLEMAKKYNLNAELHDGKIYAIIQTPVETELKAYIS